MIASGNVPCIAADLWSIPRVLQNLILTTSAGDLMASAEGGTFEGPYRGQLVFIERVCRDIGFVPPTPLARSAQRRGFCAFRLVPSPP